MKILQVISYFNPKFGGDVNVCVNISKELAKRNHEVTIITTDFGFDSQFADQISNEGIRVIPFPCVANFLHFWYSPSIKTWLNQNIWEFDIIHSHTYRSYENVMVRKFAIKYGVPYVIQAHGAVLSVNQKKQLKNLFDVVWGNKILKDASKLIALTDTEKEQYKLKGIPKSEICIIPNGINLNEFKYLPKNGEFRKKFQIPDDCKLILYVGRLHKTKGLDLLIDAFYKLNKVKKNSRLILAGPDDGYFSAIGDKIHKFNLQNEILVIGFISNEDKIQAFIDSDVFVTPSYSGFPVTFLEACACGLPIITTNKGDVLEWIDNKVGFVVDYDTNQLYNKILEILNDENLKKKFGDQGKKLINDKFNWTKISSDIENTYRKILEKP
jgi:glycosyltransferase involved in cell wall biosynthesis